MHGVGRIKMFWMKIKILTKSRSSFSIVSIAAINPANFLLRNVASSRSVPCQKQRNRKVCQHLSQIIQEWTKQNLWKRAFKKFDGVYGLSKEDHISSNFLKGCLPQILLSSSLNTLSYLLLLSVEWSARLILLIPIEKIDCSEILLITCGGVLSQSCRSTSIF